MAVVIQHAYVIQDDIYSRMLTGELVRTGGVVRHRTSMQIVKHLMDASPIDGVEEAARTSIAKILRNPRYILIGLSVVAVVATVRAKAYLATRETKAAQPELPTSVENGSASLAAYLEAARHGSLDAEIIDRLIAYLEAVKAESDSGTITLSVLTEQWETLAGIVADHTRALAEANQLELSNLPEPANAQGATIIELRPYLEIQRELFSRAS